MKLFLCGLILMCSLISPLPQHYLSANHHHIAPSSLQVAKPQEASIIYKPITPQKPQKPQKKNQKKKQKQKHNNTANAHTVWGSILSIIGLVLLPLGIGLELPVLWIIGTVILALLFVLTIIAMVKARKLSNEGAEGKTRTNILLWSSIFLTLLGISLVIGGILANIIALWIIGAILILPGIIWIITLSIRKCKL